MYCTVAISDAAPRPELEGPNPPNNQVRDSAVSGGIAPHIQNQYEACRQVISELLEGPWRKNLEPHLIIKKAYVSVVPVQDPQEVQLHDLACFPSRTLTSLPITSSVTHHSGKSCMPRSFFFAFFSSSFSFFGVDVCLRLSFGNTRLSRPTPILAAYRYFSSRKSTHIIQIVQSKSDIIIHQRLGCY